MHLVGIVVRGDHAGELGGIVRGWAVVEHNRGQRTRKLVDWRCGQRGCLDDRSEGIAFSAPLDAEKTNGVGLVQIQRETFPEGFAEDAELR